MLCIFLDFTFYFAKMFTLKEIYNEIGLCINTEEGRCSDLLSLRLRDEPVCIRVICIISS